MQARHRVIASIAGAVALSVASYALGQQAAPPAPTDRTKATQYTSASLAAALAKLPTDRPTAAVRIYTLDPYAVNVEHRLPMPQGAAAHEAQAELFYVIDGSATLLTGGKLVGETRNGTNLAGKAIEGGTQQKFGKGDFLLVPSGIPHQFIELQGPLTLMSMYLPNPK